VGPWVEEMAGEVGDPIWSLVKEEAHQRAVSMGAQLSQRGTVVRGDVRWWRLAAHGSGRWSGHWRSLGWHRCSVSVAGGGRGVGAGEIARGVRVGGNSSTATTCKGIRAHGAAHMAGAAVVLGPPAHGRAAVARS
jgi:hypothetical protein